MLPRRRPTHLAALSRRDVLDRLGIEQLRPVQADAVRSVTSGRDTVLVMPTGGGKSAVYQLAVASTSRPSVVVSPLIALQQDQARAVREADIGPVVVLNSDLSAAERRRRLARVADGRVRFTLLAPEQLATPDAADAIRSAGPGLVVVDEAHCLSTWGHQFRPDFLTVPWALQPIGRPPILALTATATPFVLDEITHGLELVDPEVIVEGFDRPNIHLAVEPADDPEAAAIEVVDTFDGRGLVYVATRAATVRVAAGLQAHGRDAAMYHAGMSKRDRAATLERFGAADPVVVVATSAFGMGIDVPDVRFVVHVEPPETIEAYYQEIGRAGRDGAPARALMLWNPLRTSRRAFAGGVDRVAADVVATVAAALPSGTGLTSAELAARFDLGTGDLVQALAVLRRHGLARLDDGRWSAAGDVEPATIQQLFEQIDRDRVVQRTTVDMLRDVLDAPACRWQSLLAYFGQVSGPCGHCDRCDARPSTGEAPVVAESRIVHREWGEGTVVQDDGDRITVLFPSAGYRTLSRRLLEEGGIASAG